MLQIPLLRHGEPYTSLDVVRIPHHQTREMFVEVSQANAGLIRRDLRDQATARAKLSGFSTAELVAMCRSAADIFLNGTLLLGTESQTPEDYVKQVSATTGMPHVMVRKNMQKIRSMFAEMENVLNGLTRKIDWEVWTRLREIEGHPSLFPCAESLGVAAQ